MSPVVYNIYKYILKENGKIADVSKFIDTWYNEEMVCNLPVETSWSEVFLLWPEFATAVFLRKYIC